MSNSSLATYTNISGNKTSPRNHVIDTITIHCIVGQWTAKQGCDYFATTDRKCSANYVVGKDGSIGLSVDEADRSWCSSNAANDNRAVTIEVASDTTDPYAVTDAAYNALVQLVADICKRNGIKELKWKADKSLIGQVDKQNMTVHRWFAAKACPGEYLYSRHGDIAAKVNAILGASDEPVASGFQATTLKDMGEADIIAKVGALFTADQRKNGVLASVSFAQFILESGYGKSELAQNANNCFGMKCSLSGNTWGGSAWDGASKYAKNTQEYVNGQYVSVTAEFRKYQNVEQSIADHSAYLLGAMNGSKKRYEGLKGCTDYRKAVQIIKDGGYATAPDYVGNICNIIEKWNLTRYDVDAAVSSGTGNSTGFPSCPFTVQVIVDDLNYRANPEMGNNIKGQTGKGVFTIVEVRNGWGKLKSGVGWIYLENSDYCIIQGNTPAVFEPYTIRVKVADLNIRTDATIDAQSVGYTGKGTFTIVEEKTGKVNKDGTVGLWGKLKSGAGWVCLAFDAYTEKV